MPVSTASLNLWFLSYIQLYCYMYKQLSHVLNMHMCMHACDCPQILFHSHSLWSLQNHSLSSWCLQWMAYMYP